MSLAHTIIIATYISAAAGLCVYGLHCYAMIGLFLLRHRRCRKAIAVEIVAFCKDCPTNAYPLVTIQLPIYNEADVSERLIRSAAAVDYPDDRYEIQILDDSTDMTREIIDRAAADLREDGRAVTVIRRPDRKDFKAGALANGMRQCTGEYIAIFDADFVVPPDFLKRCIALIHERPDYACVQGRWGHLNRVENWLTRAQSIGIDGHFTAEQGARSYSNLCLNFNGTAGLWRKRAIEAAGGWQGDTLTEDLDLSYRAQIQGYHIRYDFDLECRAEIPSTVTALKNQQKRWAKGSVETARKLIPSILRCRNFSWIQKIEAILHLTHYFVAVLMSVLCCLTLPMLLWTPLPSISWLVSVIWLVIICGALAPCVMYTGSGYVLGHGWFSFTHFPAMLVVGTGLCFNNARAVMEGLIGVKSGFVRTPKSGSTNDRQRRSRYRAESNLVAGAIEILLGTYCFVTLFVYFSSVKYLFGFFIGAYAIGLTVFGLLTVRCRLCRTF